MARGSVNLFVRAAARVAMPPAPPMGLHHITCVCQDWETTTGFYADLGFRLVKNTVNHDAPESRHTYHADAQGTPGTTITFFEWPSPRPGRPGIDSAQHVGLNLPADLPLDEAAERLTGHDRSVQQTGDVYGPCLETIDPDGLHLRLYEGDREGPALHHAGIYGAVDQRLPFYQEVLGLTVEQADGAPARVLAPDGRPVLLLLPGSPDPARMGPGAVHHVALGTQDDDHQLTLQTSLHDAGHRATEVIDRIYFRSVYSRDPGGHIVELATPGPGFMADEPADALGGSLVLPPWLEEQREKIETALGET